METLLREGTDYVPKRIELDELKSLAEKLKL